MLLVVERANYLAVSLNLYGEERQFQQFFVDEELKRQFLHSPHNELSINGFAFAVYIEIPFERKRSRFAVCLALLLCQLV